MATRGNQSWLWMLSIFLPGMAYKYTNVIYKPSRSLVSKRKLTKMVNTVL